MRNAITYFERRRCDDKMWNSITLKNVTLNLMILGIAKVSTRIQTGGTSYNEIQLNDIFCWASFRLSFIDAESRILLLCWLSFLLSTAFLLVMLNVTVLASLCRVSWCLIDVLLNFPFDWRNTVAYWGQLAVVTTIDKTETTMYNYMHIDR